MSTQPKVLFESEIVQIAPEKLKPADYNPRPALRKTNPEKFKRLKRSMDLGIFKPILVNRRTGNIVAGHQRVDAAIDLGLKTVPVLYLDVDEKDEKRINIADNTEWSAFEKDMVQQIMSEHDFGADIQLFGFDDDILKELVQDLGEVPEVDETEVALPEQKGLETLRLIFTTEQITFVEKILDAIIAKHGKAIRDEGNPNQNGNAAFYVFKAFFAEHGKDEGIEEDDDQEVSGPEVASGDGGEADLVSDEYF